MNKFLFIMIVLFSSQAFAGEYVIDFDDDVPNSQIYEYGRSVGVDLKLNSIHSDDANIFLSNKPLKNPPDWVQTQEKNHIYTTMGTPNDPLYQFQWNFDQVNAEGAWKYTKGEGVIVAVIDTGVALQSGKGFWPVKDLSGTKWVKGYDFVDDNDSAWDCHGHGTHVAGTIAQTTGNKYGVAGLAYESTIMPLRVLSCFGGGSVSDIADSIMFAADNGAHVINMSLGSSQPSSTIANACKYAHDKGVVIVAAAGNSGSRENGYPAAHEHVIAVAATQFDKTTTFYSQYGEFIDIAAPGGNTQVDQNNDGRPDGIMQETLNDNDLSDHDFSLYMGTSMASPHVAAVAALIVAQGVSNPDTVEEILKDTAESGYDEDRYGAGILDAEAAVASAASAPNAYRSLSLGFVVFLMLWWRRKRRLAMFVLGAVTIYVLYGTFLAGMIGGVSAALIGICLMFLSEFSFRLFAGMAASSSAIIFAQIAFPTEVLPLWSLVIIGTVLFAVGYWGLREADKDEAV